MTLNAPPDKIVPLINNFRRWSSWSPYEKLDPAMKRTFSGSVYGTGAVYEWEGNSDAGAGRMMITDTSSSKVVVKLDFLKPFEGHNTIEFILVVDGGATNVTWAMYGPSPYLSKVMALFFSMETMLGRDFESGLNRMKGIVEKS